MKLGRKVIVAADGKLGRSVWGTVVKTKRGLNCWVEFCFHGQVYNVKVKQNFKNKWRHKYWSGYLDTDQYPNHKIPMLGRPFFVVYHKRSFIKKISVTCR